MPPEQTAGANRWLRYWFLGMALAGVVALFFWMDGLSLFERSSAPPPPPVAPLVAVTVAPPAPTAEPVETLEEEAQNLVKDYFQAANQGPGAQLAFLAQRVDYLGHPGWSREQVKTDLAMDARKWTHQQTAVIKKPAARVIETGRTVECDVPLRFTGENAVVKNVTSSTLRLRFEMIGGRLLITSVSEVPGTRRVETLEFRAEAQMRAAIAFVTQAVVSGSSSSGMTPEAIAAMYVEKPDYFGSIKTHDEIIKETQNLISLWEDRTYRVLEPPLVLKGLGSPDVEVQVGLDFHVASSSRAGKTSRGWVRSRYLLHFGEDGLPLIQKHAEIDRGK